MRCLANPVLMLGVLHLAAAVRESIELNSTSSESLELLAEMEHRSSKQTDGLDEPPLKLDGTVAKKGWECGQPEKDVPNRDLVKNAKDKAQNLVYLWLRHIKCPEDAGFWRVLRPRVVETFKRGDKLKSSISGNFDALGGMMLEWDIDKGQCGTKKGKDRRGRDRTFPVTMGKVAVLCSDLMDEGLRKTYGNFERLPEDTAWYHV